MSVDIIQPFSSPQFKKRASETISLASDGSSKCAEIFVTNNADKWTFFCAYCQKATCDIGAFICHIRLEHLNVQPPDSSESQGTCELKTNARSLPNDKNLIPPMTTIHTAVTKGAQEPLKRNIMKEEVAVASNEEHLQIICSKVSKIADITSSNQSESIETDNLIANKNSIAKRSRSNEIQDQLSEFETLHERITNDMLADVNESNNISCYSLSDDDIYFESNAYNTAGGSKPNKRRRKEIPPKTTMHTAVARDVQEPLQTDIIKEEERLKIICSKVSKIADITLSNQPESIETDNLLANKNLNATRNRSNEIQDHLSEDQLSITNTDFANVDELNTLSCYSLSDDETYFESNAYNTASGSKSHKKRRKELPDVADSRGLHYKCPTCNCGFKTKQAALQHILYSHDENYHKKLPIKCRVCHRGFHTTSGLKAHIKSHDKRYNLQCPVCPVKHKESYFIAHVLTHESETCFPCQVCGKVHDSNDERMRHWETHAKEKPYYCKTCYRRYSKQFHLTRHLKIHNQYQCNFCSAEFVSTEDQRAPYLCASCEKLPDTKHLRSMAYKNQVFDSDEDEVSAHHNEKSIDSKQFMLLSKTNNETRGETYNDLTTHLLNEEMNNDDGDDEDEFLNEDGSDLEFVDETCDVDNNDDHDDDVPSGSGHNISQLEEDSTHKCLYCYRVFKSKQGLGSHLKCHINNDHARLRFKCSYCNRCFQTKSTLMFHYKTHDINKYQFKCPVCPFSGYRECDFINHVLTHEDESCFPCQVCGKILPTNEERLAHWKTHLHEKPHGCKLCYRRFALKRHLHRHVETHIEYM